MAKDKKPNEPFPGLEMPAKEEIVPEPVRDHENRATVVVERSLMERMSARLEELEAQLAESKPAVPQAPALLPEDPERKPNFTVKVKDGPTLDVYARDHANAWEEYRKLSGMIRTEHTPVISPITAPAA